MSSTNAPSLGIVDHERGGPLTPSPHGLLHPESFDFPVIRETMDGVWVEYVVRGDPGLEPAFIAAARRLVERGAVAITCTCGFSIRQQRAVAAAVDVPVVNSSLLLLPLLLRQLAAKAKIAVLTYDSRQCTDDVIGIADPADRARIVVGGIEGSKYWHDGMKRPLPPTDVEAIERDVGARIATLRAAHPEIAAILLECTAFPSVAEPMRRLTNLPVYDITDLCRMTMASVPRAKTQLQAKRRSAAAA
jgi:hypothetical protein